MHFIEAHQIVHEYAHQLSRNNGGLVAFSTIKVTSKQMVYDAFVIFFGHTVLYHTISQQQMDNYFKLLKSITLLVDDDVYNKWLSLNGQEKELFAGDCMLKGYEEYKQRILKFDFGDYIQDLQHFIMPYTQRVPLSHDELGAFMDKYIAFVYSKTSFRVPCKEDYPAFWPFPKMAEFIRKDEGLAPAAQKVYGEYRNYILLQAELEMKKSAGHRSHSPTNPKSNLQPEQETNNNSTSLNDETTVKKNDKQEFNDEQVKNQSSKSKTTFLFIMIILAIILLIWVSTR